MWTKYSDKILWKMISLLYSFIKHWWNACYLLGIGLGVGIRIKQERKRKEKGKEIPNLPLRIWQYPTILRDFFSTYASLNFPSPFLITYSSPTVFLITAPSLFNVLLFQVQDLKVASPATVSRCGMVFVDPEELKWMPYVKTWMNGISKNVSATRCSPVSQFVRAHTSLEYPHRNKIRLHCA